MNTHKIFIYSHMERYTLQSWNALPIARMCYRIRRDPYHDFFVLETVSGRRFRYQFINITYPGAQISAMVFKEKQP
jgi:hypothetical protein